MSFQPISEEKGVYDSLTPVESDQEGSLNSSSFEDWGKCPTKVHNELNSLERKLGGIEAHYRDEIPCWKRAIVVTVIALAIIGVATFFLFASGHLLTVPQDFMYLVHHVNYMYVGIGGGIALTWVTGASIVIYRAHKKREDSLKNEEGVAPERGTFVHMEEHLETVLLEWKIEKKGEKKAYTRSDYVDLSTLDEKGNGKAYLYTIKGPANHYAVSTVVTFIATPIYLISTVAYNLIRAAIVPFYVLVQYLREKCTGETLFPNERPFELLDIPKQFFYSIGGAIQAPFYALAYFFAGLYSLVNPMGGRKLGAAIERDWNAGVHLSEGFWSILGKQNLWQFEGGGGPLSLGRNGFYLAGCWQPTGVVEFENGTVKAAYSRSHLVDSSYGTPLEVEKRTSIEASIQTLKDKKNLITEALKLSS